MTTRRDFIIQSMSAASLLAFVGPSAWAKALASEGGYIIVGSLQDFMRVNVLTGERTTVRTPTKAHSFIVYPEQTDLIVGVEKWGRHLSLVDFKKAQVVKSIEPDMNRNFYGHLCWTRDQKCFISPQTDVKTGKGYLVWYDKETLRATQEMEFNPGGSHEFGFIPHTDVIAITSSGLAPDYDHPAQGPATRITKSTVSFVDTSARKIVREWDLNHPGEFPGHLKVASDGHVYFVTSLFGRESTPEHPAPKAGGVYDVSMDQPIREWVIPAAVKDSLQSELLSIELNEKLNRLVVTNPTSRQLLSFDLSQRKFLSATKTLTTGIAWNKEKDTLFGFEPGTPGNTSEQVDGFAYQHMATTGMSSHILFV